MSKKHKIDRRKFLISGTTSLCLPFLPSLFPSQALAQSGRPLKLGFLMFPLGTHVDLNNNALGEGGRSWMIPDVTGGKLDITRREALQPLKPFLDQLIFPLNLYVRDDSSNDAPHHGHGQFLTAAGFNNQPFFPTNYQYNLRSIDHEIGAKLGYSRANLEHLNVIDFDSYGRRAYLDGGEQNSKNCIYPSWIGQNSSGGLDLSAADEFVESQPRKLFDNLFPNAMNNQTSTAELKRRRQKSILDSLVSDIKSLEVKLNKGDKDELGRYLTSVRELESTLVETQINTCSDIPGNTFGTFSGDNNLNTFRTYTRQMMEVIALGMSCDKVKLLTYLLDSKFYGRGYNILYNIEYHAATHLDGSFGTASQTIDMRYKEYRAYNKLYTEMFAYLIELLQQNGSLDSTLLVFGSGTNMIRRNATSASDHRSIDLPVILAGKANGKVTPGRVIDLGKKVRLGSLWQKVYNVATNDSINLGKSLAQHFPNQNGAVLFDRSDNTNIPL